jgi:diguanylate cyclase (GGDEF)-like protein
MPFAIGVFDINDLKIINDTEGHKAGDEYIKAAAKLLCTTFAHSPVFRIGGDEFAIFLRGDDYDRRNDLINELKKLILNNRNEKTGPVIAVGMSEFKQGSDTSIEEVFDRADTQMYENKRELKAS